MEEFQWVISQGLAVGLVCWFLFLEHPRRKKDEKEETREWRQTLDKQLTEERKLLREVMDAEAASRLIDRAQLTSLFEHALAEWRATVGSVLRGDD